MGLTGQLKKIMEKRIEQIREAKEDYIVTFLDLTGLDIKDVTLVTQNLVDGGQALFLSEKRAVAPLAVDGIELFAEHLKETLRSELDGRVGDDDRIWKIIDDALAEFKRGT